MKPEQKLESLLSSGNYSAKQLHCNNTVIAWSHSSRFKMARKLLKNHAGQSLLDYGCGDGTFLAMNQDLFPKSTGLDNSDKQVLSNQERFSTFTGINFILSQEWEKGGDKKQYQVVTCMEVLEHCVGQELHRVLGNISKLLAQDGTLYLSVPIETGLPLVIKQLIRTVAAWRKLGDYQYNERYTWSEFFKMIFAGKNTAISRPVYSFVMSPTLTMSCHPHKGFNWKNLRLIAQEYFEIKKTVFSPLPFVSGLLNSQVFFVCKHKKAQN